MDKNNIIESGGFYFIHNFDSGNLGHVERVPTELIAPSVSAKTNAIETPDYEFNMWTRPDCAGTEFENGNRTWFYFGVQAPEPGVLVRLNLINLNKQGKMYNQGMAPVTRTLPGKPHWERIRDRPVHSTDDNTFTLSFKYRTSENLKATTFFAFTYPFSFAELQIALNSIDLRLLPLPTTPQSLDDIYYHRECLIYSLEGRRVDLLTVTSHHGITSEREERLKNLFPDKQERPFKFKDKKVIFISARVHPGETPSSFVFNGFLNLILSRNDPIALHLRRVYVFKMIPFLNPDGVARGHYRTDTRGVNLNRVYLNPSLAHHPTVYASRALIRYYHFGCEKEDTFDDTRSIASRSIHNISESAEILESRKKKVTPSGLKSDTNKSNKTSKPLVTNKSLSAIKQPSTDKKNKVNEAANLAEQVCDMKLQEQPSLLTEINIKPSNSSPEDNNSLLNDNVLRSCLGSEVHISTSEELNLKGNNPLRPLRDTLKNSISLLMESSSSVGGDSLGTKESRVSNVKMGWCRSCKLAITKMEDTMPGLASMVPGYNAMTYTVNPTTIEEYRLQQKYKIDELERKAIEAEEKTDEEMFCTNCFKRYHANDPADEDSNILPEIVSSTSVGETSDLPPVMDSGTGDAQAPAPVSPPIKEDKPKSPSTSRARKKIIPPAPSRLINKEPESGLYLYIDLHGHASKKGIFMYGNHFDDIESSVECMLLPRIMSLNNLHFHFSSCNFTERNMYLKDRRDGMSREGSGRVAVLKATGLVRSYTLECNYNTGRLVNILPPTAREGPAGAPATPPAPPKYTPHIFEEVRHFSRAKNLDSCEEIDPKQVGRSLGASILDLTGQHPNSRIPGSEHRNLSSVREWLRTHTRTMRPQLTTSRLRPKGAPPAPCSPGPLYARSKPKVTDERKENTYAGARSDAERRRSPPRHAAPALDANNKFAKKTEPAKSASRTRYLADTEPKPRTLAAKRRNVLAIRKPNASKTQVAGGGGRGKASRRAGDEADSPRGSLASARLPKLSKRSASRAVRCRALASSSSEELALAGWEEVAGGTALAAAPAPKRRSFPHASPSRLKKIRLKTGL